MTPNPIVNYRPEANPSALLRHLTKIRSLADEEREAVGFLPESAYRNAIVRRRLIGMHVCDRSEELVGFIHFGGVFPHARVQQIVVAREHRHFGVATALVNEIVSRLEPLGYLTITAKVASDLAASQLF